MITLKNWFFDVLSDKPKDFDTLSSTIRSFIHFASSPATSMGFNLSNNFAIIGETTGGNKITVSGITLMSKIISSDHPSTQPFGYSVINTSGDTYRLLETDMDKSFRKEFISKIVHINNYIAASL